MIELIIKIGDITKENTDIIVNAANELMLGGGGVDGAIHKSAGPELLRECLSIPIVNGIRCSVGEAKITGSGYLQSKHVIHTVGPKAIYSGNKFFVGENEKQQLYNCWYNSLSLANNFNAKSISFPSISTGIYCFPINEAAKIALTAIKEFEINNPNSKIKEIRIVTFTENDYKKYKEALGEICI